MNSQSGAKGEKPGVLGLCALLPAIALCREVTGRCALRGREGSYEEVDLRAADNCVQLMSVHTL